MFFGRGKKCVKCGKNGTASCVCNQGYKAGTAPGSCEPMGPTSPAPITMGRRPGMGGRAMYNPYDVPGGEFGCEGSMDSPDSCYDCYYQQLIADNSDMRAAYLATYACRPTQGGFDRWPGQTIQYDIDYLDCLERGNGEMDCCSALPESGGCTSA